MSGILLHLQRSQKENLCVQRSSRSIFIDRVAQVDLIGIRGPLQIQTLFTPQEDFWIFCKHQEQQAEEPSPSLLSEPNKAPLLPP